MRDLPSATCFLTQHEQTSGSGYRLPQSNSTCSVQQGPMKATRTEHEHTAPKNERQVKYARIYNTDPSRKNIKTAPIYLRIIQVQALVGLGTKSEIKSTQWCKRKETRLCNTM